MAVSLHKYMERLNRSKLLTAEQIQQLLSDVPSKKRPSDAASLARWLVRQGHLTPFQAKAIYLGHTKGLIVGNYVILDMLGSGGMGQVYKARHRRMKRVVALKLLSPAVAKQPQLVSRFHQEVEAAAKLMHPNIVTAFDADEAGGKHFLVMEYVPGRDLGSLIRERGPLSVNRSIRCILDAARGLDYAHKHGVVHRDVKPTNLLLVAGDNSSKFEDEPLTRVKILDMGLARIDDEAANAKASAGLTMPGVVMGTVDFMSPEQAVDTHEADHQSDIYSLGITLHYLLTAAVPFTGSTVIAQVLAHREQAIPSLKARRPEVPSALDGIFAKMIAKQTKDRYQSMSEVVTALEGVLTSDESETDLPIMLSEANEDSALASFLESMAGDASSQKRAAAGVMTPASTDGSTIVESGEETIIVSDPLTTPGARTRVKRRQSRSVHWGPILLHAGWSIALLAAAIWMYLASR